MKRSLLLTVLAPVLAAGSLNAAVFLEIDGIKGESTDNQHAQSIEIESFSWGASNPAASTAGSGGGGTGKVQFQDIHFSARLSKATPRLLVACASTNPIPRARLFVRRSDADPVDYYTVTLENVLVSSLKQNGAGAASTTSSTNSPPPSGGSPRPSETFSLNFTKIEVAYVAPDGTVTTGTAERDPAR